MSSQAKVARMRTRDQAMAQLLKDDPETAITRNALESMIASGKLPHVCIGNKVLINYDTLLDLLAGGLFHSDTPTINNVDGIRPIQI